MLYTFMEKQKINRDMIDLWVLLFYSWSFIISKMQFVFVAVAATVVIGGGGDGWGKASLCYHLVQADFELHMRSQDQLQTHNLPASTFRVLES